MSPHHRHPTRNRKGIALIVVVSILALMTLLTLAMFTLSESELKGARHYASGAPALPGHPGPEVPIPWPRRWLGRLP